MIGDETLKVMERLGLSLRDAADLAAAIDKDGEKAFYTKKTIGKVDASEFEMWWLRYPEKVGKAAARKAFERALSKTDFKTIYEGIGRYITSKWPDRQWCHPSTWLNQERWLDVPARVQFLPGGKVVPLTSMSPVTPEGQEARERYLAAQRERDQENPNPLTKSEGSRMLKTLAESLVLPPPEPNGEDKA